MTRDTLLLLAGVGLTVNEAALRDGPERPYMLMLFAGMMGLPVFLRSDEKKQAPPPGLDPKSTRWETTPSSPSADTKCKPQEFRTLRLA